MLLVAFAAVFAFVDLGAAFDNDPHCERYPRLSRCPKPYRFICGSNGVTYSHPCVLCFEAILRGVDIKMQYPGKCKKRKKGQREQ
ncbi:trypsin inhibitor ClTI-1-like [Scyliorhinus torazame]|uniref:trypsin inhibitor ClTI-1-like n=1 Tax=Scyliorhinus torazame TaxID=75743 RepID=UPI003B599CA1